MFEEVLNSIEWKAVEEEFSNLLSRYIQFDTTNPPGNETPALEFIGDFLKSEGFDVEIKEKVKNRGNLICSWGPDNTEIILLSHADVVPAKEEEWSHHPFSGDISDGFIWGRGTLDCKGLGIMELAAMVLLKRAGFKPSKGVKLIIVADEEMGGKLGAGYITNELGEGEGARFLLNEGGAGTEGIIGNSKVLNPCYGEKGPLWLKLISKGKPGHGSVPHSENANQRLASALFRITSKKQPLRVGKGHLKALRMTGEGLGGFKGILIKIISSSKLLTSLLVKLASRNPHISAMFRNTISITILKGGYKENVIPEESYAVLDIRLLPGEDPHKFIGKIKKEIKALGDFDFEITTCEEPSESELEGPFVDAVRRVSSFLFKDALFIPVLATGFTDSRFFRKKGVQALGLTPCFLTREQLNSIHGIDEKMSVKQLKNGIKFILCLLIETVFK